MELVMKNKKSNFFSWVAVITGVVIWGVSFLSIKTTVMVLPAMTQAFWRLVIAAVCLFIMMRITEPKTRLNRKDAPKLLGTGFLGITLYFWFENTGLQSISASTASLIVAIVPILTIIAETFVYKVPMTGRKLVSVLISFVGVYFIVAMGDKQGTDELLGCLLMLGAVLTWVVYTLVSKDLCQKYSSLAIVYYQTLFGIATCFPFILFEKTVVQNITMTILLNMIFLGVFCSAVASLLYIKGMNVIGVGIASLLMNLIPVVSVAASFLLLNERLTLLQLCGGALVLAAVFFSKGKTDREEIGDEKEVA